MKANTANITMNNGTVRSGEFKYERTPRVLKAYGSEYTIPVRTVEFEGKLEQANKAISATSTASDTITAIREGISLFIGDEETERIFPKADIMKTDVDEVLAFWQALNLELKLAQDELLAKYRPAPTVRR